MCKFNSDDHFIYDCGQESLRRNGVVLIVNKRVWNAVTWMHLQNWQIDLFLFPKQTIQYHINLSICPNTNAKEAEVEQFYDDI